MQKNLCSPAQIARENEIDNSHMGSSRSPIVVPDNCDPSDEAFKNVAESFIQDVILDICFQVHRASKVGIIRIDDDDADIETEDIFGQVKGKSKVSPIICPHCSKKIEPSRFVSHLEKCMAGNGRQSSKNASQKIRDIESDGDDYENESDVSYSSSKKRPKKKSGKAVAKRKAVKNPLMASTTSGNSASYQSMNFDSCKEFLRQFCGVNSKHTKKKCMNSLKCAQHTEEQRKGIRNFLLSRFEAEQKRDDVQIDVDTVDEESNGIYQSQSVSRGSSPEIFNEFSD